MLKFNSRLSDYSDYLARIISNPIGFESIDDLLETISELDKRGTYQPEFAGCPFICLGHLMQNPHLANLPQARVDMTQLMQSAIGVISLWPIDQISPHTIEILGVAGAKLDVAPALRERSLSVMIDAYVRAEDLEPRDANSLRQAVSGAFASICSTHPLSDELQRRLSGRLSQDVCRLLERDLGFSASNMQAMAKRSAHTRSFEL